jgi:hypothetical protein
VCAPHSADVIARLPYTEIDTVDIGGPGQVKRWSTGQQVGLTLAFGLPGAIAGAGSTKIQTVLRVHTADCEMFFLHTQKLADALRIELSIPLKAIRDAHPGHDGDPGDPEREPQESVTDQLTQLAAMLDKGLLTRDEFEHLKARIIAQA